MKPADRLNNLFQRLQHPTPSYETEEHRTYRVKIHLPAPTQQLVASPERAAFKRLLDTACAGKKAASPQKSKEQAMEAVCDVLEMILGVGDMASRKSKRKRGSKSGSEVKIKQEFHVETDENGVHATSASIPSTKHKVYTTSGKRTRHDRDTDSDDDPDMPEPTPIFASSTPASMIRPIFIEDDTEESSIDDGPLFVTQRQKQPRHPSSSTQRHDAALESPSSDSESDAQLRRRFKRARRSGPSFSRSNTDGTTA